MLLPTGFGSFRPSVGFVGVVVIYAAALGLIVWGLRTPLLEDVWVLEHELKAGLRNEITPSERDMLARSFERYPGLAQGLLDGRNVGFLTSHRDGWCPDGSAVVARTIGPELHAAIEVDAPPSDYPVLVEVRGAQWQRKLTLQDGGASSLSLPASTKAEIVEVIAHRASGEQGPSFKLSFEARP